MEYIEILGYLFTENNKHPLITKEIKHEIPKYNKPDINISLNIENNYIKNNHINYTSYVDDFLIKEYPNLKVDVIIDLNTFIDILTKYKEVNKCYNSTTCFDVIYKEKLIINKNYTNLNNIYLFDYGEKFYHICRGMDEHDIVDFSYSYKKLVLLKIQDLTICVIADIWCDNIKVCTSSIRPYTNLSSIQKYQNVF